MRIIKTYPLSPDESNSILVPFQCSVKGIISSVTPELIAECSTGDWDHEIIVTAHKIDISFQEIHREKFVGVTPGINPLVWYVRRGRTKQELVRDGILFDTSDQLQLGSDSLGD